MGANKVRSHKSSSILLFILFSLSLHVMSHILSFHNEYQFYPLKQQVKHASQSSSTKSHYINPLKNEKASKKSGFIIFAKANSIFSAQQQQQQQLQDREIIQLNSKNFYTELNQYKQELPHLNLIQFYLPHNRLCTKFKPTFTRLAKEINSWRNVIRLSAIDISNGDNSLITGPWSVDAVPTLKIHPPLKHQLAKNLHHQFKAKNESLKPSELHEYMSSQYRDANVSVGSLDATRYIEDVATFKQDIMIYIDKYVRATSDGSESRGNVVPSTWPNLHPVIEPTLKELLSNHPRRELFLIVEPPSMMTGSLDSGLRILMELSSSSAWKAVRYVRAIENEPIIGDILTQLNKSSISNRASTMAEASSLGSDLSSNSASSSLPNELVLIHISDAHPSIRTGDAEFSSVFASAVTKLTAKDLESIEAQLNATSETVILSHQQSQASVSGIRRAARQINYSPLELRGMTRYRRSSGSDGDMTEDRKVDLFVNYIKQVHVKTNDDRAFVKTLDNVDEDYRPTSSRTTRKDSANGKFSPMAPILNKLTTDQEYDSVSVPSSFSAQATPSDKVNIVNLTSHDGRESASPSPAPSQDDSAYQFCSKSLKYDEYGDKLKAIEHIFEHEIVKLNSFSPKLSLETHLDRSKTIIDLINVIRAYYPLPDTASSQFLSGIERYLSKERSRISSSLASFRDLTLASPASNAQVPGIESIALKQEIDRLKEEEKRLPEIKEYKYCKLSGYPCAFWRLFHTLTAFEYMKLRQIRQQNLNSKLTSANLPQNSTSDIVAQPSSEEVSSKLILVPDISRVDNALSLQSQPSPVEHLVSPPSTTTSLSLTIASNNSLDGSSSNLRGSKTIINESDLPAPVLLVMRAYVTSFFSCNNCAATFGNETESITVDRIRNEPAEYSILELWKIHNRFNKLLSVSDETNPKNNRKVWFPTYDKCPSCYKRRPSYVIGTRTESIDPGTMFSESISWDETKVLDYLFKEYTRTHVDSHLTIFGQKIPMIYSYIMLASSVILMLFLLIKCSASVYEHQKRHKNNLVNGNGASYSTELQ